MQTAKLLRNSVVASALLLGGCEFLNLDPGQEAPPAGDAATARLPPPPPPAPRVVRSSVRRLGSDRDVVSEAQTEAPPQQPAEATQRDGEPASAPGTASGAPPQQPGTEVAAVPSPSDLPPPVDPASEVRPQRVVGLTENALARWLGPPANTREESPARVWRYQGIECAFDVFFYLDLVSREFRALRYEVKGSPNDDQRCLQPVFAGRGAPPRTTARRVD